MDRKTARMVSSASLINIEEPSSLVPERSRCYGFTLKDVLKIFSTLVIPLLFSVFTVVLSMQQQSISQEQRRQDLDIARQLREQDLNISDAQRHEAMLQREQDLNLSVLQRAQDLNNAEQLRRQNDDIAEKQRQMQERQREHELNIEAERYKKEEERADRLYQDGLLSEYIRDVATMRSSENFSLNNPITAVTLSAQTQHVLRQLDSKRKVFLLEFIYKAGLLMVGQQGNIDLDRTNLMSIDFSGPTDSTRISAKMQRKLSRISLPGTLLSNASFVNADLRGTNFSSMMASHANFSYSNLEDANFFRADLRYADLRGANLVGTHLTGADLTGALVDWPYLYRTASLLGVTSPNGIFIKRAEDIIRDDDIGDCMSSLPWNQTKGRIILSKETADSDRCYFTADIKEPLTLMQQVIDVRRYEDVINEEHISFTVDGEWGDNRTRQFTKCDIVIQQLNIQLNVIAHGGKVV